MAFKTFYRLTAGTSALQQGEKVRHQTLQEELSRAAMHSKRGFALNENWLKNYGNELFSLWLDPQRILND